MEGFFPIVASRRRELPVLPRCGLCRLYKSGCRTPKMKVAGRGAREVLIIGEAPGKDEDRSGEPFTGGSGWRLRRSISATGLDPFRDCWLYNSLICYANGQTVNKQAVDWCRPNVVGLITELKPKVILLLGAKAVRSVIGWLWKEDTGGITRWAGFRAPSQQLNAWVCPTFNPAYIMRLEHEVADRAFDDHVRRAVRKTERPWSSVPDWSKDVDVEINPDAAADKIARRFMFSPLVAFDYETNMIKPDHPKAQVVCCAISDGKYTVAFPWHGAAAAAARLILASDKAKIGFNMKFEDRWSRDRLGVQVRNWRHDGMQVAHALDNRHQITGLKFQAFVRLGMSSYDDDVKPYLESDDGGGYGFNRVKDVPLPKLLLYCGLDALLEFKVYQSQRKELRR
jgi:uracil-DNA glycosylase family 4